MFAAGLVETRAEATLLKHIIMYNQNIIQFRGSSSNGSLLSARAVK
jgi:hypothetical protein